MVRYLGTMASLTPALPLEPTTCTLQAMELKFNCFFLMPLVDTFPSRLRVAVETVYDEVRTCIVLASVACSQWQQISLECKNPCLLVHRISPWAACYVK